MVKSIRLINIIIQEYRIGGLKIFDYFDFFFTALKSS